MDYNSTQTFENFFIYIKNKNKNNSFAYLINELKTKYNDYWANDSHHKVRIRRITFNINLKRSVEEPTYEMLNMHI